MLTEVTVTSPEAFSVNLKFNHSIAKPAKDRYVRRVEFCTQFEHGWPVDLFRAGLIKPAEDFILQLAELPEVEYVKADSRNIAVKFLPTIRRIKGQMGPFTLTAQALYSAFSGGVTICSVCEVPVNEDARVTDASDKTHFRAPRQF